MKKIIKYIIIGITFFLFSANVNAASLSVYANQSSVYVGGSVVITVKGSDLAGKVSITSSNGSVLSGGASSVWIENESKTYTFRANSAGTATITVTPIDVADFSGNVYGASKSVTVTVRNRPVVVLSKDSSLSSLTVGAGTLSPEFNKDVKEYSVTLPPETTTLEIGAVPNHGGATVAGHGTREVTDGDNRLEIVVTAENGTTSTYVINAKVEEYNPIKVNVDGEEYTVVRKKSLITPPSNYQETIVKINEEDVPAYVSDVTKYTLVSLKDKNGNQNFYVYDNGTYKLYREFGFGKVVLYPLTLDKIPDGYHEVNITYNNEEIKAYKYSNISKFALMYGMNIETGEIHTYMYDANEDTLQIYNDEIIKELEEKNNIYFIFAIVEASIVVVLLIIMIVMIIKNNKAKKVD